ncbi:transcriptional regulator with XRE-family HTH domain [Desulfohalotomaculum tongense]|uniref:helix-turn-helix domain-containing protein n=1 Tax=Desulforadius tongensis TaxID=1216062 RepID=UPI001A9CA12D|nr:helix-turn-helix transcriptional regulator [Desulforadius tongensis]MBM7854975.1 transcriptional regulator with XRE-family HTH domain [Desulforadius tongensis]
MIDIGVRIKELRKQRNISAKQLAITLGVSQSFISGIENGTKKCSIENLYKICNALGITLSEFFADTQEAKPLPPEVRQVIDKVKKLPPQKLKVLNDVLDTWADD